MRAELPRRTAAGSLRLVSRQVPRRWAASPSPLTTVYCDLTAPDGSAWRFGDPAAESVITGAAGAFCRVGAQRLAPADSGLRTHGPYAEEALRLLRNYAVR